MSINHKNREFIVLNSVYTSTELLSNIFAMLLLLFLMMQLRSETFFNIFKYPVFLLGIGLCALQVKDLFLNLGTLSAIGLMLAGSFFHYFYFSEINLFLLVKIFIVFLPISIFLIKTDTMPFTAWTAFIGVLWLYVLYSWKKSPDGYLLFFDTSRNYVSLFCLLFCFFLAVVWEKSGKDLPFVFCILCFLSSVWAVGRSGIIASAMLVTAFSIKIYKEEKQYRLAFVILCLVALIVLIMTTNNATYSMIVEKFFNRFRDHTAAGSDNERMYIYTSYISEVLKSPRRLLFGINPETVNAVIAEKRGNLHNSFLQFHAYYGILFLGFILCILASFKKMYQENRYSMLIVSSAFMLRCLFDYSFPGGFGDIIMWYLILTPFCSNYKSVLTYN